jgi:hypothetical protein
MKVCLCHHIETSKLHFAPAKVVRVLANADERLWDGKVRSETNTTKELQFRRIMFISVIYHYS